MLVAPDYRVAIAGQLVAENAQNDLQQFKHTGPFSGRVKRVPTCFFSCINRANRLHLKAEDSVAKARSKKAGRPSKSGKTVSASPSSLPPAVSAVAAESSITPPDAETVPTRADGVAPTQAVAVKKPFWDVGKDSKAYEQAMRILAMRTAGIDDKEIAANLGLTTRTVWNYCYIAGKNGWADSFTNAKDQIEFGIMPKVVRELEAGLDDQTRHVTSGMKVSQQMALKIAEGTVFRSFEQAAGDVPSINNVIAIRIEHGSGAPPVMRVDSGGGVPAYTDADVDGADNVGE